MSSALLPCLALALLAIFVAGDTSSEKSNSQIPQCNEDITSLPNLPLEAYDYWGVTTEAHECTNVTRRIIYTKKGNIVDAAIATMLCMGVALPHRMGIGGGFIATLYNQSSKKAEVLVARERASICASQTMFDGNHSRSIVGGLAVAVPGELRGYGELHKRYGKLNWSDLFDDAIQLAIKGFHIGEGLANALKAGEKYTFPFANKTRQAFLKGDGHVLEKGDKLVQKDLAETLKAIAANGVDYFYKGDLAKEIIQEVQENGGVIIASDLANYSVSWMTPLNRTLKGNLTMFTAPPPGSGGIVSFVLGIMDAFRTTAEECLPENVTTFHRFTESCKFGYAKRALLGDVDFENCSKVLDEMTSKDEAEKAMRKINDTHTLSNPDSYGFVHQYARHDAGNSHATFWNHSDMIITISSTINHPFGSWIRTNSGVLLNNQMDSFSTPHEEKRSGQEPANANFIKPRKRPMSSMAPTVVVDQDGTGFLALGGTGGSLLASGIALVTMRTLGDCGNIKAAIDKPRLHNQFIPSDLMVEPSFPEDAIQVLDSMGHNVTKRCGMFNVISGVQQKGEHIHAYSDPRQHDIA